MCVCAYVSVESIVNIECMEISVHSLVRLFFRLAVRMFFHLNIRLRAFRTHCVPIFYFCFYILFPFYLIQHTSMFWHFKSSISHILVAKIFCWKLNETEHQHRYTEETADFHWMFAKLSRFKEKKCSTNHHYKMRFQHKKNVGKNIFVIVVIGFNGESDLYLLYISFQKPCTPFLSSFLLQCKQIYKWHKHKWCVLFSHVKPPIVFMNRYEINSTTKAAGIQLIYAIEWLSWSLFMLSYFMFNLAKNDLLKILLPPPPPPPPTSSSSLLLLCENST